MTQQPDEGPERPNEMQLPDGRVARVVEISDGVMQIDVDDESNESGARSAFALAVLATGTMVLSVGVGGMFGVFAGLAVAGSLIVAVGFLLALT